MRHLTTGGLMAASLALSGCATNNGADSYLRFAPPEVTIPDPDYSLKSANLLIDKFIVAYRKAQNANADARQGFEVPGFLVTIGVIAASAFGGGRDVALAGATASTLLKGGNAYYAPKAKAAMYASALEAMTCIQNVSTGSKPFEIETLNIQMEVSDDPTVYYLVRNGALGVDQILRSRLANAGSLTDLAGIAAEYQAAVKKELDARAAGDKAKANFVGTAAAQAIAARTATTEELQAQIQQCILRAKT